MPLPVSAQVFIPNPSVGLEASRVGFEIGKQSNSFANFVEGGISGFKSGLDIIEQTKSIQDKFGKAAQERRRREEARKVRELEQQDRRLDIADKELDIRATENSSKNSRAFITQSLKQQEANKQQRLEHASGLFLADGNNAALIAELGEGSPTRFSSFARIGKDPELGQALSKTIEERLATGRFANPAEATRLKEINEAIGRSSKIVTSAEGAAEGQQVFRSLGITVEDGHTFTIGKAGQGQGGVLENKLFRIPPGGEVEDGVDMGSVQELDAILEKQGLGFSLTTSVNQINERERILRDTQAQMAKQANDAIQNVAQDRAQGTRQQRFTGDVDRVEDVQTGRPAKQGPTPPSTAAARSAGTAASDSLRQKIRRR